ncbi:MAG: hypothetical protein QME14_00780 [Methanobacteriaceae archaeon]|nr:hypothetical protein [Methanobacteriaceae archaeon]
MKGERELPNTILDEIIQETIKQLKEKSDFDDKTILELENIFKHSKITPESLIEILRGDPW